MKVVGFCGSSGSGKTTLIAGVVAALRAAGEHVSVIKHAHGFDIDQPGKDSHRLREAGAFEVLLASPRRLALQREFGTEVQFTVHELLAELVEVDWVLVEGYRHADIMKVEVWRQEVAAVRGDRPAYPDDPFVLAIATDHPDALPEPTLRPVVPLNDAAAMVAVLRAAGERLVYDRNRDYG